MKEIGRINKSTENIFTSIIKAGIFSIIMCSLSSYLAYIISGKKISINEMVTIKNFIQILLLPLLVFITLIIHESIHIFFFKYLSNWKAIIKVRRDKSLGAIVMQQINDNVTYSKIQTIIILLAPCVIITIISIVLIPFILYKYLILLNCLLNIVGSSIDFCVSLRLVFDYNNDIRIKYNSGNDIGMILFNQDI